MVKGILFSLGANILFGLGYYFAILLQPLADMDMFGFRILVLMPFILLAIVLFSKQMAFKDLFYRIKNQPSMIFIVLLLAFNTGVQLWLFMWAPNNGQALQVSIGYLLLPIVTVALGKLVFKERLSKFKWAALAFAVIGVAANIVLTGTISWATFVAGFGYPLYIMIRIYYRINNLATFFVELALCLPIALYYIAQVDMSYIHSQNSLIYLYLALFGLVNGLAFILYIGSSNLLPMNVLGLLGYAEPLVMLFISFAIGEVLDSKSYILMICLAISILLLSLDSFQKKAHPPE